MHVVCCFCQAFVPTLALGTCCDSEQGVDPHKEEVLVEEERPVSFYWVGLVKGGSSSQVGREAGLGLLTDRLFSEVGRGCEDFAASEQHHSYSWSLWQAGRPGR